MTAVSPAALAAAREVRQLLGLSGSHDREVADIIARHVAQPTAPEPVRKAVERILDEHSAWIARPNAEVTDKIALACTIAAHHIVEQAATDEARHLAQPANAGMLDWSNESVMGDMQRLYDLATGHRMSACKAMAEYLSSKGYALAASDAGGWRPIETAPKDGTRLLLWDARKNVVISGRWHVDGGRDDPGGYEPPWSWWVSDEDHVMWDSGPDDAPTHWMPLVQPLPSPPAERRA